MKPILRFLFPKILFHQLSDFINLLPPISPIPRDSGSVQRLVLSRITPNAGGCLFNYCAYLRVKAEGC